MPDAGSTCYFQIWRETKRAQLDTGIFVCPRTDLSCGEPPIRSVSRRHESAGETPACPTAETGLCHGLTWARKTPTMASPFPLLSCAEVSVCLKEAFLFYGANAGCDVEADAGLSGRKHR